MLTEHGCPIAPSSFYDNLTRVPSRRAVRDEELKAVITTERRNKFVARLGARKLWLHLRRKGHDVARCSMAETRIGLFKNECIRPDGPWRDVNHVEKGTFEWVTWFNKERTQEAIDDLSPIEAEEFY